MNNQEGRNIAEFFVMLANTLMLIAISLRLKDIVEAIEGLQR